MSNPKRVIYRENPAAVLQSAFETIYQERMRDIPLINSALQVASVGFQRWQGHWLGVLVTPWFINLMLLPGQSEDWPELVLGEKLDLEAPSGQYGFSAGYDDSVGEYLFCSLLSPVSDVHSQAQAVELAEDVLRLFLLPPEHREMEMQNEAVPGKGLSRRKQHEEVSESRRNFLRGQVRSGIS